MRLNFLTLLLLATGILLPVNPAGADQTSPQVVVSIKPIHSLVSGIMAGAGTPVLLIQGGGSPHGYALRPSEARALNDAQLIIWVGPELESFLEKSLKSLGSGARQLQLTAAMQDHFLPSREGGTWEKHDSHSHAGHHSEPAKELDPHLWLDPVQAQRIAVLTVAALCDIDPANQELYRANGEKLRQRLASLQIELGRQLAPVADIPYIVFHDAYQYFEKAFALNVVGSVTLNPERSPGLRRVLEIRNSIKNLGARAVFSEPQFEPRLVATVIEGTGAVTGTLDPIGADLAAGPDSYFVLMRNLAEALAEGLRQASQGAAKEAG